LKLRDRIRSSAFHHEAVQLAMQLASVKLAKTKHLHVTIGRNPSDTFEQISGDDKMKQGSRHASQVSSRHEVVGADLRDVMLEVPDLAFVNDPTTLEHVRSGQDGGNVIKEEVSRSTVDSKQFSTMTQNRIRTEWNWSNETKRVISKT
jgi:hypothetical protein